MVQVAAEKLVNSHEPDFRPCNGYTSVEDIIFERFCLLRLDDVNDGPVSMIA
jgi:hypothetical protein